MCEGYRRADGGAVRVLGLDPSRDSRELHNRIGVMLQSGGVYPAAHASEMLLHIARLHVDPIDPEQLIDRLGLRSCGRTPYRRLSGGQKQRLALAMAVVGRPELVFLDEPTAGLDPQARRATWELIDDLRQAGVSVLLTTHLMDEAERLADHVVIIDHGRVVAEGTPQELTSGAADRVVRFKAPAGLDLASLARALPEDCNAVEEVPGGYRVDGEVTPQLLATLTAWCASRGVMPDGLTTGRRSLEDVFLDLTGHELR